MFRAQRARLLAGTPAESHTRLLILRRGEVAIGKEPQASLRMVDELVAPRHAVVRYRSGKYFLKPLPSEGGTFLNGLKIKRAKRLEHGDAIRFGPFSYRFIDPDALKRMRNRRIMRISAVAVVLISLSAVHLQGWDSRVLPYAREHIDQMGWHPPSAGEPGLKTHIEMTTHTDSVPPKDVHPASMVVGPEGTSKLVAPVQPKWLEEFNRFRTMAGLSAIEEIPHLSSSVDAHTRYLMANYADQMRRQDPLGDAAYDEDPKLTGYSADGAEAAPNSQLAWGCGAQDSVEQIDRWLAGPFHRVTMLSPSLKEAGFGQATHEGCWVRALRLPSEGEEADPYPKPIEFPPDDGTVALELTTGETPDPLTGCAGYTMPAGLPITLQIGWMAEAKLGATTLTENGKRVEHCAYNAQSYENPNAKDQEYGRWALRSHGAIVMIPRAPLEPGGVYQVSIAANDKTYNWSFKVASK